MTTTSTWTVVPLPVPASLDAPDAWALLGASRVDAAVQHASWGHWDLSLPSEMLLGVLGDQRHEVRAPLVALRSPAPTSPTADDVVGVAHVTMEREGNTHLAQVSVLVDPAHRHQGAGTALLEAAEAQAVRHGRTLVIADATHTGEPPADHPDALTPPTGAGRILATTPSVRLATGHGYTLEQGVRYSTLPLPLADPAAVDALEAAAQEAAGAAYTLVRWTDRCPDEWVDQHATLLTRMSTAVPTGGLDVGETPWDAARVRDHEEAFASSGRHSVVTAALDVASGTLVGYTEIAVPRNYHFLAFQEDTLVLPDHRGHRLGMLMKAANLRTVLAMRPALERIHTWNAEENRHMLSINEAMGFTARGVTALWQKRLG